MPRPSEYTDGEPKVDAHRKYIQQGYLWVQNWLANYVLREVTGEEGAQIWMTMVGMKLEEEWTSDPFQRAAAKLMPYLLLCL